jgi:hypothetical protein
MIGTPVFDTRGSATTATITLRNSDGAQKVITVTQTGGILVQ